MTATTVRTVLPPRPWQAVIGGLAAAAAGVGLAELAAAIIAPRASPLLVVGSLVIDLAPKWVKDLTIALFGVLGFWLYSLALQRASVTAATAPLVLLETLVPAVVGLTVFGDGVRSGWWPVALVGFALSIGGALILCGAEATLHEDEQPAVEPVAGPQPA